MAEIITDASKMAFGKFKDYPLVSVPASHLLFLFDKEKAGRYKDNIKSNMDVLIKKAKRRRRDESKTKLHYNYANGLCGLRC